MRRFTRLALAALLLDALGVPIASAQTSGIPTGFTSLFNGRNLDGWHTSRTSHHGTTGDYAVEDGNIVLRQRPIGQGGLLVTNRRYRNFELYLEAKPDRGTNGGIFFRATEGGSGFQIEMIEGGGGGTGNLLGELMRLSKPVQAPDAAKTWKLDDWNSFRIRVEGDTPHITLWMNGIEMWDYVAERNDLAADATDGFIAFETHWTMTPTPLPGRTIDLHSAWRPGAAQRFRNIGIKELK